MRGIRWCGAGIGMEGSGVGRWIRLLLRRIRLRRAYLGRLTEAPFFQLSSPAMVNLFVCLFIHSTSAAANAATTTTLIHLGDLWSGSEGGSIKIWPREALEKALSLTAEERHMSSLLVERSYIEPWTQVAVNGFTNILTSDVRYLLSDRSGAKLWTAGYLSFALWYVTTLNILFFLRIMLTIPDKSNKFEFNHFYFGFSGANSSFLCV